MSTESSGCSTDSHLASACLPSFVPRQGVVSHFCRDALDSDQERRGRYLLDANNLASPIEDVLLHPG